MKNIVVADKDKEGLNAISGFAVNAFLQGAKPKVGVRVVAWFLETDSYEHRPRGTFPSVE